MVATGPPGKVAEEVIGIFKTMTGDVGTSDNSVPTSWNQVKNVPTLPAVSTAQPSWLAPSSASRTAARPASRAASSW
jgi:hypothetical protein